MLLLTSKFDLSLNQGFEQILLVLGELLSVPFALSYDVLLLFVLGDQLLHQLRLLLSNDGLFLGLLSLLSHPVPFLEYSSGSFLGDSDLVQKVHSSAVDLLCIVKVLLGLRDILSSLLSLLVRAFCSLKFSLGNSDCDSSSDTGHVRVRRSPDESVGELGFN